MPFNRIKVEKYKYDADREKQNRGRRKQRKGSLSQEINTIQFLRIAKYYLMSRIIYSLRL